MLIYIENWNYLLTREADNRFRVWHHITPADACYGTEVDVHLPADYFQNHSVKRFYEHISQQQNCRPRPQVFDKHQEIKDLTAQLRGAGWLD